MESNSVAKGWEENSAVLIELSVFSVLETHPDEDELAKCTADTSDT